MKLTKKDLDAIIGLAQLTYSNRQMPICIEGYESKGGEATVLDHEQGRILCLVEATASYLNGKDVLKEQVQFSFKIDKV